MDNLLRLNFTVRLYYLYFLVGTSAFVSIHCRPHSSSAHNTWNPFLLEKKNPRSEKLIN